MYYPCDGPAVYGALTVGTSAVEVCVGASPHEGRKCVTIQPLGGDIYYGFDSSVTTSTGTKIFQETTIILEIGPLLPIYVIAASSNINVRITEVG